MKHGIKLRAAAVLIALLAVSPAAKGADERLQVQSNRVRNVVIGRLDKPRPAEIVLKDGAKLTGIITDAESTGLRMEVKAGAAKLVPYEEVSMVRLELGSGRARKIASQIIGALLGAGVGAALSYNPSSASDTGHRLGALAGAGGGWYIGNKIGNRHRKWLVIEVIE